MDIWAWVEKVQDELRANGRERLADLMDLVPHYMSDNMHEQLDAVMPEALALAREAKNPWIEVYLRHWNLQSRVLQRYLVEDSLPEAVNLIDFANREDTKSCPQSVCTTQDLTNCYAHLDGPGYAHERLAVASETLSRIDAEWPCFTCISGEYATALIDDGRAADALSFIEAQRTELVRVGRADRRDDMCGTEIDALVTLGRLEEARELNERAKLSHRGASFHEFRQLDEARILARLGHVKRAQEALLPFDVVLRTPSQYEPWADAQYHLAIAGAIENGWRLGAQLFRLVREMRKIGVVRRAIAVAQIAAKLALARGRPHAAARLAEEIEGLIGGLRTPLGAREDLAKLRQKLAEASSSPPPPPPRDFGELSTEKFAALPPPRTQSDALFAELGTEKFPALEDPGEDALANASTETFAALTPPPASAAAAEKFPAVLAPVSAENLAVGTVPGELVPAELDRDALDPPALLATLGEDPELDLPFLERAHARSPAHAELSVALSKALLALEDEDRAIQVLRDHLARDPDASAAVLALAELLRARGRDRELVDFTREVLARTQDVDTAARCRWMLAQRDRERGDYASAKAHLEEILRIRPDAVNTRALLAELERDAESFDAALAHLDRLVAENKEPGGYDWDRMVVGMILGREDVVRHSARRLGFELPADLPLERDGEPCIIRFQDRSSAFAVRTGPVTARIINVAHPQSVQHYADRVVFEARPENPPPEPGEEEDHLWIYPCVRVLSAGGYTSYIVDGVDPGEERLAALERALKALGCRLEVQSAAGYTLEHGDVTLPGLFAFLAVPAGVSLAAVHEALVSATAAFEHPLTWAGIAEALGDETEAERQAEIASRYAIC